MKKLRNLTMIIFVATLIFSVSTWLYQVTKVIGRQLAVVIVEFRMIAVDVDTMTGLPAYDSTPDSSQAGWSEADGTSFSAPVWSAMIALADQGRTTTPLTSFNKGNNGYSTKDYDFLTG